VLIALLAIHSRTVARVGPTTPQSRTRADAQLFAIGKVVRRASHWS
jgi:hypothetical protein